MSAPWRDVLLILVVWFGSLGVLRDFGENTAREMPLSVNPNGLLAPSQYSPEAECVAMQGPAGKQWLPYRNVTGSARQTLDCSPTWCSILHIGRLGRLIGSTTMPGAAMWLR